MMFADGITKIPEGLFAGYTGIESIEIPDTVKTILSYAFAYSSIQSVKIGSGLTTIESCAFYGCRSLTEINLPDSLTKIGGRAFASSSIQNVKIGSGLTTIDYGAFENCSSLTSINLPDSLTAIGSYAFENCINLGTIEFPESLITISYSAFSGCSSLSGIKLPSKITKIEDRTFYNCSSLKTAEIPEALKSIGTAAFYGCAALEAIVIPDNTSLIEYDAFENCSALKSVKTGTGLRTVQYDAFRNCDALTEVIMQEGVTTIGNYVFYDCDELETIVIPNSVTSLGKALFYDCDELKNVSLGTGITTIPASMFYQCPVLESVVLPFRVTTVGNNAFANSTSLTSVTVPRSVTSFGNNVFSYPSKLTIYGVSGTTAETYAGDIGATFVAIDKPATGVTLSRTELTLNKGQSAKLFVTVEPNDFTDATKWKTSDSAVATIADDGTVKAVGVGTATISFIAGNTKASCTVTVLQPVTRLSFTKSSISLDGGDTVQLAVNISPEDAANKDIVFSSSDESVATVDQAGLVTALKKGTATITVAAQDGSDCTATCKITVLTNATVCKTVEELQSKHNYDPNSSELWVYTQLGAKKLSITFSEETSVEEGSDYIFIYDKDGNELGKYTGTELAGKTIEVEGDTVKIKLTSDEVMCEYGFAVTKIETDKAETPTGDITGDGDVDVTDLIRLKKYIADNTTALAGDADLNGDGIVDILDLIRLKKIIAGETSFS